MSEFQDFLMEDFGEVEVIEKELSIGGKKRKMKFKPLSAGLGDELRNKCKKISFVKGQKIAEVNQDKYLASMLIETTVSPDLKDKALLDNWGAPNAEELLKAMKFKMLDGEYTEWVDTVVAINGYDKDMSDLIEEAKN